MLITSGLKLAQLVTSCRAYLSPTHIDNWPVRASKVRGGELSQESGSGVVLVATNHYSGAKKVRRRSLGRARSWPRGPRLQRHRLTIFLLVSNLTNSSTTIKARSLGRALSWPRVLGQQRLDSVTVSLFVFFYLIWQIVQSGAFCNDTQDQGLSENTIKARSLRRARSWPRVPGLQRQHRSRSHFLQLIRAKDYQKARSKQQTTKKRTYAEIDIFEVTTSISWFLASKPLLSMGFPWFLGHSTIDFNSHVPSMMGRRNCFDGPFTSNFHWHCFWTFLNELL